MKTFLAWIKGLFNKVKVLKEKADAAADTILKKLDTVDEAINEGNIEKLRKQSADIRAYIEWFKDIL